MFRPTPVLIFGEVYVHNQMNQFSSSRCRKCVVKSHKGRFNKRCKLSKQRQWHIIQIYCKCLLTKNILSCFSPSSAAPRIHGAWDRIKRLVPSPHTPCSVQTHLVSPSGHRSQHNISNCPNTHPTIDLHSSKQALCYYDPFLLLVSQHSVTLLLLFLEEQNWQQLPN